MPKAAQASWKCADQARTMTAASSGCSSTTLRQRSGEMYLAGSGQSKSPTREGSS